MVQIELGKLVSFLVRFLSSQQASATADVSTKSLQDHPRWHQTIKRKFWIQFTILSRVKMLYKFILVIIASYHGSMACEACQGMILNFLSEIR